MMALTLTDDIQMSRYLIWNVARQTGRRDQTLQVSPGNFETGAEIR